MLVITLIVFAIALMLGLPIAIAIGTSSIIPSLMDSSFIGNAQFVIRAMMSGVNSYTLLALPLFMLSGDIMCKGGISKNLFDVFALLVGKRTAGMPCAVILTCLFFGMISGSGPATCAAVGAMALPILTSLHYDKVFCGSLLATAAGLAVIIPPSLPYVTICSVTGASIGDLMIAGIIPGCLIALCLMGWTMIYCKRNGEDKEEIERQYLALKSRGIGKIMRSAIWALLFPVLILGGIYGGFATPTEVAALSVLYALLISLLVYKSIRVSDIPKFFFNAAKTYAPICILLAIACAFARVLTLTGAAQSLAGAVVNLVSNKVVFILVVIIILLILGMFIDVGPANVILAPIFLPVAQVFGFNTIHFLLIMVCCLAVGFVTPPFGMNLFVAAPLIGETSTAIGKKSIPFIIANVVAIVVISLVPWFTMALIS